MSSRTCSDCGVEANPQNTGIKTCGRYYSRCRKCDIAKSKAWRKANPEKSRAHSLKWKKSNPEICAAHTKKYNKAHPGKVVARSMARKALKQKRTVLLTPIEQEWLQFYYDESAALTKESGVKHEVDHIKPLSKGGLHAPWNMQVLTKSDNCKKGARWHSEAA